MRHSMKSLLILALLLPAVSSPGQIAAGKDKFLGNIIANGYSPPALFDTYWNQVTPENSGKWGSVEGTRNQMNWGSLDKIYEYAKQREIPFRMHTLVWGQQQPGWIASLSREQQLEEVEEWIAEFGDRFPETDFIDVVNEPLHAPPSYMNALGGSGSTGWDWVIRAFELARAACPDAKLHLNDYGILNDNGATTRYLVIVNLLKDRGLIDGICEQGHFFESTSTQTLTSNLNRFAAVGLPVYITEHDVNIANDTSQLNRYKQLFPVFWGHSAVQGVTLWGYIQGQIWRTDSWLINSKGVERPAMEWLKDYVANETAVDAGPEGPGSAPGRFKLHPNSPNPFNPSTRIAFELTEPAQVRIEVFDLKGRTVAVPVNGRTAAGFHEAAWDARDRSGRGLPGGVYVYRMTVADGNGGILPVQSRTMLLLK
ncbi:endo-1,4-beta-xylanase [bacterium]|nr:endo-1,4-beta-xylanase [bacterium]